jgi:hypothetical protein
MIQKIELIELIRHRVEGEARTKGLGKFHPTIIEYNIGRAFNSLLIGVFKSNLSNFDSYTKTYSNVDIQYDSIQDIYYSDLPAKIIQLPRIGDGIMRIVDIGDSSIQYVPMTNGMLQNIDGLDVDSICDVVGYVFKNGRVEYQGVVEFDGSQSYYADQVAMELVIPFEEYADTDNVQIPTGSDVRLFELVTSMIFGTPDSDNLNNNNTFNPNIRR